MIAQRTNPAAGKAREQILAMIEDGRLPSGQRLPAEQSLCVTLGVSRGTLRTVLTALERDGTLKGSKHLGRTVASSESSASAVLREAIMLFSDWRAGSDATAHRGSESAVDAAFCGAAAADGRTVVSLPPRQRTPATIEGLRHAGLAGAALRFWQEDETAGLTASLGGRPLVSDNPEVTALGVLADLVTSDHAAGCELLVQALAARGCRRILRVWSASSGWWLEQRNQGYERACRAAGLGVLPAVVATSLPARSRADAAEMEARTRAYAGWIGPLLAGPEAPDAILTVTDADAFPIAAACRLFGRTPGRDLRICGYDGYWDTCAERRFEPSLPVLSIDKRNAEIGSAMYALLRQRIAGGLPATAQHRIITPRLVEPS